MSCMTWNRIREKWKTLAYDEDSKDVVRTMKQPNPGMDP